MTAINLSRAIGACIALALLSNPVAAQDWGLVINGKSIHVGSQRDWNESNWGLGIEREFDRQERWVKVALGNGFRDSNEQMSYMVGGGIKRRFRPVQRTSDFYVDVGVIGFLMSRQDMDDGKAFPGMLPALSVGVRNVALNVTYLPKTWANMATNLSHADPGVDGIFFIQLKLDAALFGFGRRNGPRLAAAE